MGHGRWPYSIDWNWGGGAGLTTTGEAVGIQFGKVDRGHGVGRKAITVDGRLHKIGRELRWTYDWERPMEPWRVVDPGGAIDLAPDATTGPPQQDERPGAAHRGPPDVRDVVGNRPG